MKNTYLSFATSAVLTASVMIAGSTARAEDLPQTKLYQQFSVTQGFSDSELPVLQRAGAADQNKVTSDLIGKLRLAGTYQSTKLGTKLHITGEQWSLDVAGDGSAAEYRDLAVEARSHSLAKPLSEQMPAAELEQKGRAFIASKLASQIVLGTGEELVAVRADYRTDGGQDLTTGEITNAVSGNRIVFGRTLNGVPVVGNGSKVILTFSNDGSLESFRYDWPTYQAGASQKIVDAGKILLRLQKVIGVRSGIATPTLGVVTPGNDGEAYPVALTPNTQLQALECGYYDVGSMSGHTQSVQPGCTYLAVSQGPNGTRNGYAGAVPAGSRFATDAGWLETQILGGR
jgi:hypothetical protein